LPLSWFRRKAEEQAPVPAAAESPQAEPTIVDAPAEAPVTDDAQSTPTEGAGTDPKKRRRGTRGGRNRRKKPAGEGGAATAEAEPATEPKEKAERRPAERKSAERKPRAQQNRRRQAPKRGRNLNVTPRLWCQRPMAVIVRFLSAELISSASRTRRT